MRTLVHISGILIAASGGLVGLAGCTLGVGWMFWVGLIVFAVGWQIANSAGKKTCPQCAERVKVEALTCKHCGNQLDAVRTSSSPSKPLSTPRTGSL